MYGKLYVQKNVLKKTEQSKMKEAILKASDPMVKIKAGILHDDLIGSLGQYPEAMQKVHDLFMLFQVQSSALDITVSRINTLEKESEILKCQLNEKQNEVKRLLNELKFTK